jgi:hypothetical protein
MLYLLEFDEADNPMYLKKVGNWVITFVNTPDEACVQLALSSVLPRSLDTQLQIRQVLIKQHNPFQWQVLELQCFDALTSQDFVLDLADKAALHSLQQILKEFERYDVIIRLINRAKTDIKNA